MCYYPPDQVMDLEAKLAEMQKEVSDGGVTRKTRSAVDWIPRPPEKLVNQYIFSILYLCIPVYSCVFLYILLDMNYQDIEVLLLE